MPSSAPHWPALDDAPRWSLVLASSAPHWPALDDVVVLVAIADETADVAADVVPGVDGAGVEAADVIPGVNETVDEAADVIPDVDEAGAEIVPNSNVQKLPGFLRSNFSTYLRPIAEDEVVGAEFKLEGVLHLPPLLHLTTSVHVSTSKRHSTKIRRVIRI